MDDDAMHFLCPISCTQFLEVLLRWQYYFPHISKIELKLFIQTPKRLKNLTGRKSIVSKSPRINPRTNKTILMSKNRICSSSHLKNIELGFFVFYISTFDVWSFEGQTSRVHFFSNTFPSKFVNFYFGERVSFRQLAIACLSARVC